MRCCREQPSSHLRKDFWLLVSDHPPLWPPATQMSDTESTYEDSNYDTPSSDSGGVGGAKRHTGDADPRVPPRVALRVMAAEAAIVANATATSKKTGQPLANTGGRAGELLREAIDGLPPTKRAEMLALLPPQREQPKFCKDQLTHLRVHGTCWDAPRPGRPPKALSEAELAKGVKAVVKACPAKVDDMVKLPYFRCIWRRKSIGPRGVLRQLCKYEPRLGKRLLVEYKQPLTPKLMRQRVATTKDWLEKAVIPEEPSPSLRSNPRPIRRPPATQKRTHAQQEVPKAHHLGGCQEVLGQDGELQALGPAGHAINCATRPACASCHVHQLLLRRQLRTWGPAHQAGDWHQGTWLQAPTRVHGELYEGLRCTWAGRPSFAAHNA